MCLLDVCHETERQNSMKTLICGGVLANFNLRSVCKFIFLSYGLSFFSLMNTAYADGEIPQITPFGSELSFVTNEIFYEGQALHRASVSSDLGAMTVEGFPGVEGYVQRFQVTSGCARNNWDCRAENQSLFTRRNEVSLPRNKVSNSARIGDVTVVEYDIFIASNPYFPNLSIYEDFFFWSVSWGG